MKKLVNLASIIAIAILVFSCANPEPGRELPAEDDFISLHLAVERSDTDTVKLKMDRFYKEFNIPANAEELSEGHYYAESPYDDYQYKHLISFDVLNGKFENVEYDEVKINGGSKTLDEEYSKKMNEHVPGSAPSLSYDQYEDQLENKQNILELDAISGATYSLYRMQLVAARAIAEHEE